MQNQTLNNAAKNGTRNKWENQTYQKKFYESVVPKLKVLAKRDSYKEICLTVQIN